MSRTLTTRLLLSKPNPGTSEPYDASVDLGTNWDKVDGAVSFTECTSGTRPTGADAWDGRGIIESDTGKCYVREDGAWRQIPVNTGTSVPIDDDVSITGTLAVSSTMTTGNPVVDYQVFTSSGTWNKPAGAKSVLIEVVGGGGGAGGAAAAAAGQHAAGGGGAAGGYAKRWRAATDLGSTETVTIGAGGAGGAAGANNGASGGVSSFGTHAVAGGGGAGTGGGSSGAVFGVSGGLGGIGTTGTLLVRGGSGGWSMGGPGLGAGGQGGDSHYGGGAVGPTTLTAPNSIAGGNATGYGAGGSGGLSTAAGAAAAGGAGLAGVVQVTTYFN